MASITKKNSRRYRIQFSMNRELYETYEAIQTRSKELGLVIEFNEDFTGWFRCQLREVMEELKIHEGNLSHEGGDHA